MRYGQILTEMKPKNTWQFQMQQCGNFNRQKKYRHSRQREGDRAREREKRKIEFCLTLHLFHSKMPIVVWVCVHNTHRRINKNRATHKMYAWMSIWDWLKSGFIINIKHWNINKIPNGINVFLLLLTLLKLLLYSKYQIKKNVRIHTNKIEAKNTLFFNNEFWQIIIFIYIYTTLTVYIHCMHTKWNAKNLT